MGSQIRGRNPKWGWNGQYVRSQKAHGVGGSPRQPRKWVYKAAKLGISCEI